ncbi:MULTISPECIES: DeoR/GlpR family DNA-binding transcription regulator [Staphylococcus]|uniref:DeoR/GlpR family DNA-binding transcription regulator n=1 Tax=Staphylococcus TaxID=1279 RepID=UPI000619D5B7|nr:MULTISPECIES: DeoR/GlpR family DNA-binding transcription regulator [Staphylococcus]KKD22458.1 DeoR faimly transcriptional regulator [Staphylococcus cohnii subsp. cohnii]KKD25636.1 DeoR faimly transcriptional regulator [Staphylococcus cohnii subsp. cohnii]MBM9447160.1 DeoR/GlpR transcriptional regulator [Staphylococcus ureilyticus]MCQ9293456.1 DeoR/GlpR family DNA-binding transcription regulator [Staphylococcus cohnii]MDK7752544.1 DeoR/GlpR family DNA-binding transcription regulator [Staphyl
MITEKRQELILTELSKKDFLTLQELIDRTGCSASTIRRDLSKLQKIGKLKRVHGGAMLNESSILEPNLADKRGTNLKEKQEIARLAALEIEDNECIFIDAGSTTLEMIPYIDAQNIIVVTSGLTHVEELIKHGIRTFILGGEIKSTTYATVGASALETLKSYRFDKVFLGMNGIDLKYGLTTPDEQEAIIKKHAIYLGSKAYVLADHDKYDKVYFAHVPVETQVSIVTSKKVKESDIFKQYTEHYTFIGGTR